MGFFRPAFVIIYTWWFWVAIGGAAVAASAITAGVVLGTSAPGRTTQAPANTLTVSF